MSENTCLEKQPFCVRRCLQKMDAYWRAANYLSAGQLVSVGQPACFAKPLTMDHD